MKDKHINSAQVIRGGSWNRDAHDGRSALRSVNSAVSRFVALGFRIVFKKGTRK